MKVKRYWAWYDMWVGLYVDVKKRRVYWCPFPCYVVEIRLDDEDKEDMIVEEGVVAYDILDDV